MSGVFMTDSWFRPGNLGAAVRECSAGVVKARTLALHCILLQQVCRWMFSVCK